jgi:hypothetical protein
MQSFFATELLFVINLRHREQVGHYSSGSARSPSLMSTGLMSLSWNATGSPKALKLGRAVCPRTNEHIIPEGQPIEAKIEPQSVSE